MSIRGTPEVRKLGSALGYLMTSDLQDKIRFVVLKTYTETYGTENPNWCLSEEDLKLGGWTLVSSLEPMKSECEVSTTCSSIAIKH